MHEENFLSSWLRDSTEDKAVEKEKVYREDKEEECQHGKRLVLNLTLVIWRRKWWSCRGMRVSGGVGVSVCVLASFLTGRDPFSHVKVVGDVVVSDSDCEFGEPQTLLCPESAARVWRWDVTQRCILKDRPSKAVPESVRRRPTPQSLSYKSSARCKAEHRHRSKAHLCEEVAMEVEDSSPPWTARERVVLDRMGKHHETTESIQVEVSDQHRSQKMRGMTEVAASSCC